jgi:hypothetical protein
MPPRQVVWPGSRASTRRSVPGQQPLRVAALATLCEILTADPPRELAWHTLSTPLYPDSTEWHILIQPAGPGTRIAESYQMVRLPPAWLDRLMALVNPSHIDRATALDSDLRRLAALAATGAAAAQAPPSEAGAEVRDASRQ